MPKENKPDDGKTVLYHYTDPDSAQKIKQSGVIKQSGGPGAGDAAYGPGTYMTRKLPTTPKHQIAENNYDDGLRFARDKINERKIDSGVAVVFDKSDPKLQKCNAKERDVYKYDGDVDLRGRRHAFFNKSDFEKKGTN